MTKAHISALTLMMGKHSISLHSKRAKEHVPAKKKKKKSLHVAKERAG